MLSSGVPDNCSSSPSGWMLVKKENTTIASLVLTMWSMDKREATVYTKPATDTSYCEVTQVDPTR